MRLTDTLKHQRQTVYGWEYPLPPSAQNRQTASVAELSIDEALCRWEGEGGAVPATEPEGDTPWQSPLAPMGADGGGEH